MEGEPKVRNVLELAEKVIPNTAPQGKEIVMRETDALHRDWEAFVNALQKVKGLTLNTIILNSCLKKGSNC